MIRVFLELSDKDKGIIIKKRTPRCNPVEDGEPYTVVKVKGVNCQIMNSKRQGSLEHANHLLIVPRRSRQLQAKNYK